MAAPVFADPLVRELVAREPDGYHFGRLQLLPWRVRWDPGVLLTAGHDPAVALAARTPDARCFLAWARFPVFTVTRAPHRTIVEITDARYGRQGWARVVVDLPPGS